MIWIDDKSYNAEWQAGFEQTADILNDDTSGRIQNTGEMFLNPIGTFFNNTGTILRGNKCSDDEWDNLFMVLSNPIGEHTVKIPFNQGYLTTRIYIAQNKRKLIKQTAEKNVWSNSYTVTYTAMESDWLAGGELQGYTEGAT